MLEQKYKIYSKIIEKLKNAKHIALVSHKNPDIDTL
jgi:nanoRNase/pAp phosphatase (c-di-AMP/oligoRNAs hydrolase)